MPVAIIYSFSFLDPRNFFAAVIGASVTFFNELVITVGFITFFVNDDDIRKDAAKLSFAFFRSCNLYFLSFEKLFQPGF